MSNPPPLHLQLLLIVWAALWLLLLSLYLFLLTWYAWPTLQRARAALSTAHTKESPHMKRRLFWNLVLCIVLAVLAWLAHFDVATLMHMQPLFIGVAFAWLLAMLFSGPLKKKQVKR